MAPSSSIPRRPEPRAASLLRARRVSTVCAQLVENTKTNSDVILPAGRPPPRAPRHAGDP
jgi:hypothetical protein